VTDAWNDNGCRGAKIAWARRAIKLRSDGRESLPDRGEIAGTVIDQCDAAHKSPFVEGSTFDSCLSREQANRNARANALNTASTW
jgi:hypothetical protein